MTDTSPIILCPEPELTTLLEQMTSDEANAMRCLAVLLAEYEDDPRLHFLEGSLFAEQRDYSAARDAMRRAVDLAPDFAIARFQLGFLLLTCGEPHAAQEAWGPLHGLPQDNYLRIFVTGLCHLIRDEFDDAVARLGEGISRNDENPALNNDMQMIVDEIHRKPRQSGGGDTGGDAPLSPAQLMLQQASFKATRH